MMKVIQIIFVYLQKIHYMPIYILGFTRNFVYSNKI